MEFQLLCLIFQYQCIGEHLFGVVFPKAPLLSKMIPREHLPFIDRWSEALGQQTIRSKFSIGPIGTSGFVSIKKICQSIN